MVDTPPERKYMLELEIHVTGKGPLITHNPRLANPLDSFAKDIKAISGKKNKTEEDHLAMMRLEWEGGLYIDEEHGPYAPVSYFVAALWGAGGQIKKKSALERGLSLTAEDGSNRVALEYDGPREIKELWDDEEYRDVRSVRVQSSRVSRTRPRFPVWGVTLRGFLHEEQVDLDVFERIVRDAGRLFGVGEKAEGARARFDSEVKVLEAALA